MIWEPLYQVTLGIGFPMVATPLIALVTDVKTAILLTLVPTLIVNVLSIARGGRWSESLGLHWPLAVYTLIGSILGARLLIVADPEPLTLPEIVASFLPTWST